MARPREYHPGTVLDRAVEAFWARGYNGTSIHDLVAATGLHRGSLYGAFGDKRGLFLAALDRYAATVVPQWLAVLRRSGPPLDAIRGFLDMVTDYAAADTRRRGCLLANTAIELAPHDAEVSRRVGAHLRRVEDALAEVLDRARATGAIAPSANPRSLARFLLCATEGILVLGKLAPGRAALGDMAALALTALPTGTNYGTYVP